MVNLSWLGVMIYLSMEAIDTVFDWLITLPADSEMVLTFARKRDLSPLSDRAAEMGEPGSIKKSPYGLFIFL
jgi:O-methyltransferase involved in polyketide biosynthesis